MRFLRGLGRLSTFFPEGRSKSLLRSFLYGIMSRVRVGHQVQTFRGVRFRLGRYPLMSGIGLDSDALEGYLRYRDVCPGDVVVDAGPYVGDFTVYAAIRTGPDGKVIAFEPDPASYNMLTCNIRLNRLSNVRVVRKALWKTDSTMLLTGTAFASELTQDGSRYVTEVETVSMDNELRRMGVPKVDFVKMDIEGAELVALEGMSHVLATHPHLVIASYHRPNPDAPPTAGEVETLLRRAGYRTLTGHPVHLTTYGVYGPCPWSRADGSDDPSPSA